ncbi:MAG: hypothetical protein HFJ58_03425 [Clostridia bacterium]|nr:hypothetical protein [Clostridia bacterium]
MKVEFIGTYQNHEIKKTDTGKDYVFLTCKQGGDNRDVNILLFNNKIFENLQLFKKDDPLTVIFETWYSSKDKKQVLICKDVVPC